MKKISYILLVTISLLSAEYISIAPGDNHTIAIKADGTLWAWGYNNISQLGNNTVGGNVPYPFQVGSETSWRKCAAGNAHSLAIKADGTLWAWGGNVYGQQGTSNTNTHASPVQVGNGTDWLSIATNNTDVLAIC